MLIAVTSLDWLAISFRERRDLHFEEVELAQALANQAMLAVQLTRLSDQSRQAAVMASGSSRRDVHDTSGACIHGVIVQLEHPMMHLPAASTPKRVRTSPGGGDGRALGCRKPTFR